MLFGVINATITTLSNTDFTINLWLRNGSVVTNSQKIINITNGTNKLFLATTVTNGLYLSNSSDIIVKATNPLSSNFDMITIIYTLSDKRISVYVNSNLVMTNTSVNLTFNANENKIYLSNLNYYTIDEMSIWSSILSPTDILQLYNSGLGLNLTETLEQNTSIYGNPSCIDSNTYCTQPLLIDGSCNYADIINCAQGCDNSSGAPICTNSCTNTCNVIGATNCNDTTNIQTCDDYNGDGCYEYQITESCSVGNFCLSSGDFLSSCINVTQNGTHTNYGLVVTPYKENSLTTNYNDDIQTRTVSVITTLNTHEQNFYTSGTTYLSRTCDYKETSLYNNNYVNLTQINSSIQIFTTPLSFDGLLSINILPTYNDTNFNSEGIITLKDNVGNFIDDIYYIRNTTAKSLCLFTTFNGSIIYCDYSTNSYDDLQSLILDYSFTFTTNTYSIKVTFNREVDNIIVINPQLFSANNVYNLNITTTTNSLDINNVELKQITNYQPFTSSNVGTHIEQVINPLCSCGTITCNEYILLHGYSDYFNLCGHNVTVQNYVSPCVYNNEGIYKVRTYGNNLGLPDYSIYSDYSVNILSLGASSNDVDNANNLNNDPTSTLSTNTKYWIMLIACVLIIIFMTVIMSIFGDAVAGLMVGLTMSMLISLVLSILWKLNLLIPILYIIIGGSVLAILIRKVFYT